MKNNKLFLLQLGSALLTFCAYTSLLNWKIALLIMFGVGFHELCHLYAAKWRGMQTGGFFLLPFIGGIALITSQYKSRWDQALVILAGPLGGGLMATLFAGAYVLTGSAIVGVSAMWMLLLNLFNLLPISFMDGGQIMGAITYSIGRKVGFFCKAVSLILGMLLLVKMQVGGLIIFIGFFGGMEITNEWRYYKAVKNDKPWLVPDWYLNQPHPLTTKQVVSIVSAYLLTGITWFVLSVYLAMSLKDSLSVIFK